MTHSAQFDKKIMILIKSVDVRLEKTTKQCGENHTL